MGNTSYYTILIVGTSIGLGIILILLSIKWWQSGYQEGIKIALSFLSFFVLLLTAIFIGWQALTTNKILKNSMLPAVEVSVLGNASSTAFQFSNASEVPAKVWLLVDIRMNGKIVSEEKRKELLNNNEFLVGKKGYYIGGTQSEDNVRRTQYAYLKNITSFQQKGIELILSVFVAPSSDERFRSLFQKKTYQFSWENNRWQETSWGEPDRLHPVLQKTQIDTLYNERLDDPSLTLEEARQIYKNTTMLDSVRLKAFNKIREFSTSTATSTGSTL